ncbi:MAG: glycoside hydrolase [Acidobacteria bacterium]|nr:glycoside hydrolase [Acidobacteriota bacterium]
MTAGRVLVSTLSCFLIAQGALDGPAKAGRHDTRLADAQPNTSAPGALVPVCCAEMRYRMIGPHRGGRTKAAAGVPSQPGVFYIGATNGGVWKTTDYGRIWTPIFDNQPTGSIGAIAVAPSDPHIIYVGSGEGLQRPDLSTGNGIYKSTDAGKTWTHLGLRDGQQIPQIVIHPKDPNRLWVAVLGHPYGPNPERGLFRSTDGARTFQKVLYKDENVGAVDVVLDPSNPDIVYAVLWEARQGPWENGDFRGPGSGVYKSTDGGTTWTPINKGLPTFEEDRLGRIGITVAPSQPKCLFATVEATRNAGLYRSDDAGESWSLINGDPRVTNRASDFAEVKVHPKNPDIVFTGSIVTWKSTDGGKIFNALRGAPGGDDYHRLWIDPNNPDVILIASDQGAIITVNGGQSWSSWYNQPTAQMYHVTTDNAFPYRVCSGQQESGSVCIQSRGDDGRITFREWHPVAVEEYGYVAPDPLDPDIVYGGKVSRYDRRTGQHQNVAPVPIGRADYRVIRTMPILFSPIDPKTLYFASNTLWKTTTGGQSWTQISPDLTRETWEVPANVGKYRDTPEARPTRRGVIYTIAPSHVDINTIWVGTDDGLIHVTRDGGKTWSNVTPPDLKPWAKVSIMDASHSDAGTAYAAVNTFRLDDLRPHIYRTRDGGKTWTHIATGIPDGGTVNVVREDPKRHGLLFAGTEQNVYVSFDDGERWESLRLNMPAISIRDLVIKDDDLVLGTHGRSFWILDDITPLRQVDAKTATTDVVLFKPQDAWRYRWSTYTDTPLPPDEPAGENPPDGAIIDYRLRSASSAPVTIEILDGGGKLVRRYSSEDPVEPIADEGNVPRYWIRPTRVPSKAAGMHRFVWDLHYPPPKAFTFSFPISATPRDTWREPRGPWAMPGTYTVKLTVGSVTLTQPLVVKMDPRVKTPAAGLAQQFTLSTRLYDAIGKVYDAIQKQPGPSTSLRAGGAAPGGRGGGRGGRGGGGDSLRTLHAQLLQIYGVIQTCDCEPTTQAVAATEDLLKQAAEI